MFYNVVLLNKPADVPAELVELLFWVGTFHMLLGQRKRQPKETTQLKPSHIIPPTLSTQPSLHRIAALLHFVLKSSGCLGSQKKKALEIWKILTGNT